MVKALERIASLLSKTRANNITRKNQLLLQLPRNKFRLLSLCPMSPIERLLITQNLREQ